MKDKRMKTAASEADLSSFTSSNRCFAGKNVIVSIEPTLNRDTRPQNLHETFTLDFPISNHRFRGRDSLWRSVYGNENRSVFLPSSREHRSQPHTCVCSHLKSNRRLHSRDRSTGDIERNRHASYVCRSALIACAR